MNIVDWVTAMPSMLASGDRLIELVRPVLRQTLVIQGQHELVKTEAPFSGMSVVGGRTALRLSDRRPIACRHSP